jgi:hypothetical protein
MTLKIGAKVFLYFMKNFDYLIDVLINFEFKVTD